MVLVSATQLKHQRAGAERRRQATVSVIWAADASRYLTLPHVASRVHSASLAQWESLSSSLTAVCLTEDSGDNDGGRVSPLPGTE